MQRPKPFASLCFSPALQQDEADDEDDEITQGVEALQLASLQQEVYRSFFTTCFSH